MAPLIVKEKKKYNGFILMYLRNVVLLSTFKVELGKSLILYLLPEFWPKQSPHLDPVAMKFLCDCLCTQLI